ncbi:hypothetical protein LTS10_008447 [Elasticomyces elasticus]|nr:hypothetical protein LTS10_008447 [Elasticomyces elasticus]
MADLNSREHPWFSIDERGVFIPQPRTFKRIKSREEQDSIAKFNVHMEIWKKRNADLRAKILMLAFLDQQVQDQMDKERAQEASEKAARLARFGDGGGNSEQAAAPPRMKNKPSRFPSERMIARKAKDRAA